MWLFYAGIDKGFRQLKSLSYKESVIYLNYLFITTSLLMLVQTPQLPFCQGMFKKIFFTPLVFADHQARLCLLFLGTLQVCDYYNIYICYIQTTQFHIVCANKFFHYYMKQRVYDQDIFYLLYNHSYNIVQLGETMPYHKKGKKKKKKKGM